MCRTIKLQFHIPLEDTPMVEEHLKTLPAGLRQFGCYLFAYKAYMNKDYSRCLGIASTALFLRTAECPLGQIYLYIIMAIALINLMRVDEAMDAMEHAWALAKPDGLIVPFVEHYTLFQGMIEAFFKKNHPDDFQKILLVAKNYNINWYTFYNLKSKRTVADNLTPTEFTIAMLYSRNWRAKEIAAHMELSERTIMNYIQIIYEKLHINGKKELLKYMLT